MSELEIKGGVYLTVEFSKTVDKTMNFDKKGNSYHTKFLLLGEDRQYAEEVILREYRKFIEQFCDRFPEHRV